MKTWRELLADYDSVQITDRSPIGHALSTLHEILEKLAAEEDCGSGIDNDEYVSIVDSLRERIRGHSKEIEELKAKVRNREWSERQAIDRANSLRKKLAIANLTLELSGCSAPQDPEKTFGMRVAAEEIRLEKVGL